VQGICFYTLADRVSYTTIKVIRIPNFTH